MWGQDAVTLWEEDFSSYSANAVPSGGKYSYKCTNGGTTTKIYNESLAGGTAPELLVSKNGGTFEATVPLDNIVGDLTLTFYTNKQSISVSTTTEGISGSLSEKSAGKHTLTFTGVTTSMTEINIVFTGSGSSNVRLDDIVLTGTKATDNPAVATTVTIDASGLTNKDIYAGTEAGTLTASVTAGNDAVEGATVTWTSSDEGVATINDNGVVTLVAVGTTTIKASYAGVENKYRPSSATYELTVVNTDPNKPGTENNPYTVAQARAAIDAGEGVTGVYAKGIVSRGGSLNSGAISYYISDDGSETDELQAYKGKGIDGEAFTSADDIQVGDVVVIKGNLKKYNSTYEFDAGNELVSLVRKEVVSIALSGQYPTEFVEGSEFSTEGIVVTATYSDGTTADVTEMAEFSEPDMTHVGEQPVTVSFGGQEATYTITITEKPSHTATFSVNGETTEATVKEGEAIEFPTGIADIAGKTFVGWVAAEIQGTTDEAPEFVASATMGAEDVTFFAVFATLDGTAPTLTKMVEGDTFTAGDNIVIVAEVDDETSYALYQETQSNSYVKNYSFTANALTIAQDEMNWVTVEAGTDGKWKLGDATNGYLYNSGSNNLSVSTENASEWALEDNGDDTFSIKGGSTDRYISCRTDLTGNNVNLFRMAGSSPAGVYDFSLYKFVDGNVEISDYCTTVAVPTATITLNAACTDGQMVYGTFSCTSAFVVPEDLVVSEVGIVEGALNVVDYATGAIVPAYTGVMVAGLEGGDYEVELSTENGQSVLGEMNCLRATGEVGVTADVMEGLDVNCLFYRLTMHNGQTLGFWWGAPEGAAFDVAAGKAYLAVSQSKAQGAAGFGFGGDATGIKEIFDLPINDLRFNSNGIYTIDGRRIEGQPMLKGVYIVNGKKVVIK